MSERARDRNNTVMADQEILLKTTTLTKRFGSRYAVRDLDLEVHRGDVYGFLGPNGAGKSTTIRLALSLITPTSGTVELFGRDVARDRTVLARVGGLVERPDFYNYLSARKNLEIVGALYGDVKRSRIDAVLDMVGLLDRGGDRVKAYSHGMKQRLGIAQALLIQPEFLILDEPTVGVDIPHQLDFYELLANLQRDMELTILVVTHEVAIISKYADRMVCLNRTMHLHCNPAELMHYHGHEEMSRCEFEQLFGTEEGQSDAG